MGKVLKVLQKIIVVLLIAFLSVACKQTANQPSVGAVAGSVEISQTENAGSENTAIVEAFKQRKSNVLVEGKGEVKKLLADDNNGSRHQKFLVKISPDQTLLFAHNLDLAARVEPLAVGDTVEFKGEYVFNPKGGIVHWTHKDPQGHHEAGWIKHNGQIYQ